MVKYVPPHTHSSADEGGDSAFLDGRNDPLNVFKLQLNNDVLFLNSIDL